jgi:hypothetical protein
VCATLTNFFWKGCSTWGKDTPIYTQGPSVRTDIQCKADRWGRCCMATWVASGSCQAKQAIAMPVPEPLNP